MDRRLALGILGLDASATPEEIERAYWEKCAELEDRIRIAPTSALKKVYREALESLEEARAAALGLEEVPVVETALPTEAEPTQQAEVPAPPEAAAEPEGVAAKEEAPAEEIAGAQELAASVEEPAPRIEEPPPRPEVMVAAAPPVSEPRATEEAPRPRRRRVREPEVPAPEEKPTEAELREALSAAETAVGFLEGQVLMGRFDIRYRIGIGRTGAVYGAYDLSAQRNLAVRVLLPGRLKDPAVRQRFAAEVKVASFLSHPNICQVYELLNDGTNDLLTMELLKGRTLREAMDARARTRQPFKVREVVRVGTALCGALQYAHTYTTHRAISPKSVFLCTDGTVKLMDFGMIALARPGKAVDAAEDIAYLAPEQREDERVVDHRVDQYAVGAVLYEMLAGKVPAAPFQPLREMAGEFPIELSAAIERALSTRPEDRFPDVRAFGSALAAVRPRWVLPAPRWIGGAAAVLLLVGVAAYLFWPTAEGPEERPPTGAEPRVDRLAATEAAATAAKAATVRALAEEERRAAERAKAEAERAATLAQAEAERVATLRAQAEAERLAAAERAREEAARLTATKAAEALVRAELEARQEEERRMATRKEAEARRTATAVAKAEERRQATARAQAEADQRATARAELEQARVATAEAREETRRQATAKALEERTQQTARALAQETARAVATVRQAELDARKNFIPEINATVISLRFFEKARGEQVPEGQREYADRFKSTKTRAVYWEVSLTHPPLGQRKNFTIRSICYAPDGSVFGEGELNTYIEANWGKSKHIYGWGFDEPGHWKDGKYRVELFVGGKKIASGSFQIYSGFF